MPFFIYKKNKRTIFRGQGAIRSNGAFIDTNPEIKKNQNPIKIRFFMKAIKRTVLTII